MDSDFFKASSGDDPELQHILWLFGDPSIWLSFFLWALILIAIFKITKHLLRARKTLWLILFIAIVGTAILFYLWISKNAFHSYAEGLEQELGGLRAAKTAMIVLSILSGCWIISDWWKAKR